MNRGTLAKEFTQATKWKTFVVEAHANGDAPGLLVDAFGAREVVATDDVHLHHLQGSVPFYVDHLDDRFWSFHTTRPNKAAVPWLKQAIESRRDLDWMWLPSDHLRGVWPESRTQWLKTDFSNSQLSPSTSQLSDLQLRVKGQAAQDVFALVQGRYRSEVSFSGVAFDAVDPHLGGINEAVDRKGQFVAKGTDFAFHAAIVRRVIDRYRGLVTGFEQRALRWIELPQGGARLEGSPILLEFARPIADLPGFLDGLFSCREPFRLWGIPELIDSENAQVEAVDLHVGQRLRFDVTPGWMRVYLFEGGCGNSVARLISNLQHQFDGALKLADAELQAHIQPPVDSFAS